MAGILSFLSWFSPAALAADAPLSLESSSWRIEIDNDYFLNKDNKISSGWAIQHYSAVADSWDTMTDVPAFVRHWGAAIPTLTGPRLRYRTGIAIGQVTQTPSDLSRGDLIRNDVPYAGVMALQASWYGYNNEEFRGFELVAGVVGPPSLAGQGQKLMHQLSGRRPPKGWGHQLKTEPVINLNYMRKQKVWQGGDPAGMSWDIALNENVGLGNLYTQASAGVEIRMGHNMPGGFAYVPDPIGMGMHYMASLEPARPQHAALFTTLVLRGSAFARNMFLDGNMFRHSHSVKKQPLVGMLAVGLHYMRASWAIHLNAMVTSDDVDTALVPAAEGGERIGSIDVEWRF